MATVASIADAALDAVALAITDAIHAVTVTRTTQGAYNASTGAFAETTSTATGRAVLASERPITDIFPAHVVGPKDQLWLIEGVTALSENDKLTINSTDYTVTKVQDIAGAGTLFYVVAQ